MDAPDSSDVGLYECVVCMDDELRASDVTTNRCGHTFCNTCWEGHLSALIGDGKTEIPCMALGCATTLEQEIVESLAPPRIAAKLRRFTIKTLVQNHPQLKPCCNPKCELTIHMYARSYSPCLEKI